MSIEDIQGDSNRQVLALGLSPMGRIRCAKTWKAKHVPYVPALTRLAKTVSHDGYCQRMENAVDGEVVSHCSWPSKTVELFDRYFRFRLPTIFREILSHISSLTISRPIVQCIEKKAADLRENVGLCF